MSCVFFLQNKIAVRALASRTNHQYFMHSFYNNSIFWFWFFYRWSWCVHSLLFYSDKILGANFPPQPPKKKRISTQKLRISTQFRLPQKVFFQKK